MLNFKHIHIGQMIKERIAESEMETLRICNFFNCTEDEVIEMYQQENLPTDILLKWSKLLEYDFFRIYSQHLMLYAPPSANEKRSKKEDKKQTVPQFRKNIYTKEVIDFIIQQIDTEKMTKKQIIERYNIPKTTLYKWISKYKK